MPGSLSRLSIDRSCLSHPIPSAVGATVADETGVALKRWTKTKELPHVQWVDGLWASPNGGLVVMTGEVAAGTMGMFGR